ncbi:MAG: hypothetical protein ABIZ91_18855 [Gemmatimonadaceae bacterium]
MTTRLRALRRRLRFRARRGSALMLTMVFTFALSGLAISAIYMTGSSSLLSKLYDRERDYRYAAEWALSIGKARITTDTSLVLPDSLYVQLMNGQVVTDATGQPVPKVRVDLYAGVGGNSTGQYGRFVELVAVAYDNGGARHVRRLELQAENFARYAMFTDKWFPGCYTTGEILRGRSHSNQGWQSCNSAPGPIYTDTVSAVTTITGTAQYQSVKYPNAPVIPFPSVAKLSFMPGFAATGNLSLVANARTGSTGGSRLEFVAVDLDGDGQLTGAAEGYFRVFDAYSGVTTNPWNTSSAVSPFVLLGTDSSFTRGGTPNASRFDQLLGAGTTVAKSVIENQCGVFYLMGSPLRAQFVPLIVHDTLNVRYKWLIDTLATPAAGVTRPGTRALALTYLWNIKNSNNNQATLLKTGNAYTSGSARCFQAGDPYLMPVERPGLLRTFPAAAGQSVDTLPNASKRGGEDTTFTAVTKTGRWRAWPAYAGSFFTGATRRQAAEEQFLWPVHRTQNLSTKGVAYVNGDIYLSGTFRGRLTLYVSGNIIFTDDLTYTTNPASLPICQNLLGIVTGSNIWIADNAINRPRRVDGTGTSNTRFFDDNQDFFLHAVTLSGVSNPNATFGVEALDKGPSTNRLCTPVSPYSAQTSGGCINQAGGVIQKQISATFAGGYTGFAENRVKDACLDVDSPPFFPLTGRYLDNEFYEIDPAQFNATGVAQFYRRLQAGT